MIKIKYSSVSLLALLAMLFLSNKNVSPQSIGTQEAREISHKAQELIEQKKWTEAVTILQEGIQKCRNDEQAKECRSILNFSLGFLYQQWAEEDITERTTRLEKSAELYRRVLEDIPNNKHTMNNLAIVFKRLRLWQNAIKVLERALKIDGERQNAYYLAIGDIYREAKNIEKALESYQKASKLNPTERSPHWRILSVYRRMPDDEIAEMIENLFSYAVKLKEIGQYELAKNGFELVISRSYQSNPPLAEESLIYWAELGATQGWISEDSLQALPDERKWNAPAIKELRGLLINPSETRLIRWKSDDFRKYVAASVLKAVGHRFLAEKRFEDSENILRLALEIAPNDHPFMILDLKSELASLYHRYYPLLDPHGRKLYKIIWSLFRGKSEAYDRGDLDAIQRYHTILGLIYSEKGQWWTSENQPDNAIFQLEYALKTAEKRSRRDEKNFQPLPHLQSLLATGYAIKKRKKEAFSTYIDAAMGYLDLDSLKKSEEMIGKAYTIINEAGASQESIDIKKILDSRKQILMFQKSNLDSTSPKYFRKTKDFNWLFEPDSLFLNKSFVERQRFKTFADLGNRASHLKEHQEALRFHALAMEIIKEENILTNMDDVIRLEKIKTSVLKNIHLQSSRQTIGTGKNLKEDSNYKNGKIWWMASPSEPYPIQVGINPDLSLAFTIANRISVDIGLTSEPLTLQLEDGIVTILEEQSGSEIARRADELIKSIEGVRQVKIKEEKQQSIIR